MDDWQNLLEMLLEWEMWLKSESLDASLVQRAERKHRYLMYFLKKVADRTGGMGWKITKYHTIMHLAQDILNFGVPLEVDTGSNESAHKSEKKAARLTQKNKKTFDAQTQQRLNEMYLLELAHLEKSGLPKPWNYFDYKYIVPYKSMTNFGQDIEQIADANLEETTESAPKTIGGDQF